MHKRLQAAVCAAMVITTAAACGGSSGSKGSAAADGGGLKANASEGITSSSIKVGFMADLTGPASTVMAHELAGAQAAVQQINSSGGVLGHKLDLVVKNDDFAVDKAKVNLNVLANTDHVLVMTGMSNSAVTQALAPDLAKNNLTDVGPPQNTQAQQASPFFLNNLPSYQNQAAAAVARLGDRVGGGNSVKAAVIRLNTPSGDEWDAAAKAQLTKTGGTYLGTQVFDAANPDATAIVGKLTDLKRSKGLNAVIFQALVPHALALFSGMSKAGMLDGSVFVVGTTPLANPGVFQHAPAGTEKVAEGVHGAVPATSIPAIQQAVQGSKNASQAEFPDFSHAWTNIHIIATAIEAAAKDNDGNVTRKTVNKALAAKFDTGGAMCAIDWSTSNNSPCATVLHWTGTGLAADKPFDYWAQKIAS